jgi:hypothetical protein
MDLRQLAKAHRQAFADSNPRDCAEFLGHCYDLTLNGPRALAQDALPLERNPSMPYYNNSPPRMGVRGSDRRFGRDQMPPPTSNLSSTMPGAYGQTIDQEEESPINGDLSLHFVEICLNRLEGPERDKFVGALHNILSQGVDQMLQPRGGNNNNTNTRNGNGGRDRRQAQDRALAVAAINREHGFFQRFPEARHISVR